MGDPNSKLDPFKPVMPQIPGVPGKPPEKAAEPETVKPPAPPPIWADRKVQIGAAAGLLALILLIPVIRWVTYREPPPAPIVLDTPAGTPSNTNTSPANPPGSDLPVGPGPIASVQELAKPWSVVKFQFHTAIGDTVPAMVVRLPVGSGASAYWGMLGVAPYARCELSLEQDLAKIAQDYGYRARHPMVVDSCDHIVYDPLSYGSAHGAWVRGQVVTGPGLRPPLAIEVRAENGNIVAVRSE